MGTIAMDILNVVLSYIKCLLDFLLFYWLSSLLFPFREKKCSVISVSLLPVLALFLFLVNRLHIPQINTVGALLCAFFINIFFFNASMKAKLLLSFIEVLAIVVCEFMPILFYSLIFNDSIATVTYETIKNSAFCLISTGIFCICVMLIQYVVNVKFRGDRSAIIKKNFSIIIVPSISIFVIYYILHLHSLNLQIDDNHVAVESILVFLGILVMNLVAIAGDNSARKQYYLQRELDRLNRLKESNQIMIDQQDQFIEELKGYAHDYAKQINEIKALLNDESNDKHLCKDLQIYVENVYESINENHKFSFIPMAALRAILSQTQIRCNTEQIQFIFDIQYADFQFIEFADLYAIFDNLLSNAIEACSKIHTSSDRYINLTIFKKNNMVWIRISNPLAVPVIVKRGNIQTTKSNREKHGYGIKNMRKAVRRYGGYADIEYSKDEFVVTIALPLPYSTDISDKKNCISDKK